MSKANPVSGTLTGTPGADALLKGTSLLLLTLVLAAAWWIVLGFPPLAQAGGPEDGTPLWSADISVVDLENGAIGAVQASDFSNQAGSAGLTAKWLYHYEYDGRLRLSFTEGADVEGHLLQVGHLTLSFAGNTSGNSSFTWDDVDVDWEQGDVLPAQIIQLINGNFPPAGLPTINGRPQVNETLNRGDISDNRRQRNGQHHVCLPMAVRGVRSRTGDQLDLFPKYVRRREHHNREGCLRRRRRQLRERHQHPH